ncbi:MAG: transporter substrate-binding domain-containing protein [Bacillota bacterium]|nr:transporter substrate-binding domain-containing protein [Bacillota bacterium]
MKKFFAIMLSAAMLLTMLVGCGSAKTSQTSKSSDNSETTNSTKTTSSAKIDKIKAAGKLVMYTNAEFPPYEFMKGSDYAGVDVEIGKKIADKLGVKLEINNTNFDGIVASIGSGKGDIGLSGITITDERKEQVDFSHPYVDSVQYLIVANDSPLQYVEDFAGKNVGGQTGTTGALLMQDEIDKGVLKGSNAKVTTYDSAPTAMLDLKSKRIDAVVIDKETAINLAKENTGYKSIPLKYKNGNPMTEQYGIAVAKGSDDLLKVINEVVDDMVSKGEVTNLVNQYTEQK